VAAANVRTCFFLVRPDASALKQLQKKLEHASRKGGLTVVMSEDDRVITAYRANSFSASALKKSRG